MPFIVAHFQGSVKNRRNIYADLQNDGQERKEHQKRRSAKYRVRVNYTDSFGKPHQIDRVVFGAETAKQLELQLTQKLNAKEITPK